MKPAPGACTARSSSQVIAENKIRAKIETCLRWVSGAGPVLVFLFAATIGLGQDQKRALPEFDAKSKSNGHVLGVEPPFTFSADASLVQIRAVVLDRHDRVVGNLDKDAFRLQENGVQQTIAHFQREEAPVSICFILDSSWSMRERFQTASDAVRLFLATTQPSDEYCLVRISGDAQLVAGLTSEPSTIRTSLTTLHPGGLTALRDAIDLGLRELSHASNPHRILVILSDGGENNSRVSQRQLFDSIRARDIQVYAILPPAAPDEFYSTLEAFGAQMLESIAHFSGGRMLRVDHAGDLARSIAKIDAALHQQYLLGYYTASHDYWQGRYISVALNSHEIKSHFRIYWRPGSYPAEH